MSEIFVTDLASKIRGEKSIWKVLLTFEKVRIIYKTTSTCFSSKMLATLKVDSLALRWYLWVKPCIVFCVKSWTFQSQSSTRNTMFSNSLILPEFSCCKWLHLSIEKKLAQKSFIDPYLYGYRIFFFLVFCLFISLPVNILATLSKLTLTVAQLPSFLQKGLMIFFLWWELRGLPRLPQYLPSSPS